MTLAKEVMRVFHQNTTENGTQITNKAPARVGCEVVLWRNVFVHMIRCKAINGTITPEDQEDSNGDKDCNGQRFQTKTYNNQDHSHTQTNQPFLEWRCWNVDGNPTTDGVSQENENVGHGKELPPVHQMLITLRIKQWHFWWMKHVENRGPILHGKMTQELRCEEWQHLRHPFACLLQGSSKVGGFQFCSVIGSEVKEDVETKRQTGHNVPINIDDWHVEGTQRETQDVDGGKASWGTYNSPRFGSSA